MKNTPSLNQRGMSLIVAMILLLALTILVLAATRSGILGERIAGNHMDRTRAYQAAEQALSQAKALLTTNGDTCVTGCDSSATIPTGNFVTAIPTAWSDTNAGTATLATGQGSSAKFLINRLSPSASFVPSGKTSCTPYSILARGQGLDSASVVVLQTIAYVCPI